MLLQCRILHYRVNVLKVKNICVSRCLSSNCLKPTLQPLKVETLQKYTNHLIPEPKTLFKLFAPTVNGSRNFNVSSKCFQKSEENNENDKSRNRISVIVFVVVSLFYFAGIQYFARKQGNADPPQHENAVQFQRSLSMTWRQFIEQVLPTGEVKSVTILSENSAVVQLHPNAAINGKNVRFLRIDGIKNTSNIEEELRDAEISLKINPDDAIPIDSAMDSNMITFLLISSVVAFFLSYFFMKNATKGDAGNIARMFAEAPIRAKKTNIKFKDVAGMKEAKQEVMEFVDFLKNPKRYTELGAKMPRGCLLTGPPGVGKTLLAKAVATEADVQFIAKAGSDFVEMIGGLGARRMRSLFKQARENAPCIIYIDELDAVGGSRSEGRAERGREGGSGEKDQTLNQLLVEMDGMLSKKHQVIILASTNRSDILDKALLRPGRFDRVIQIDLPTRDEREEILLHHLSNIKLSDKPQAFASDLASLTTGMSGADLANVCNEAAIYAARNGDKEVQHKHIDYAVERVIAGAPKSATSVSPEEKRIVAIHESGHALIGWLLEHTDVLSKVTIIPRTASPIGMTRTVPSDRYLHTKEQLFDFMCMALGGRAAEDVVLGRTTQGARNDLEKVTNMAYAQVKTLGFSDKVGPLSFQEGGFTSPYSDALKNTMDSEVREMVRRAYNRAKSCLMENRSLLDILSHELLRRESLSYDDVVELIGPPTFADKKQIPTVPFGPFTSDLKEEKSENE